MKIFYKDIATLPNWGRVRFNRWVQAFPFKDVNKFHFYFLGSFFKIWLELIWEHIEKIQTIDANLCEKIIFVRVMFKIFRYLCIYSALRIEMPNYWWLNVELCHVSAYLAWNISVKMWVPIRIKQYTHAHYSIVVLKYIRGFLKADEGK